MRKGPSCTNDNCETPCRAVPHSHRLPPNSSGASANCLPQQTEREAIAHYENRSWQRAIEAAEVALAETPLTDEGWLALAESYSQRSRHSLAVPAYEHLLSRPRLTAEWYSKIYAGLKRANRPDLALAACRIALRFYPEDDAACFAMATQMSALGYSSSCVAAVLERAVHLAPDKLAYRVSLALQHCRGGQWESAYGALKEVPPTFLQTVANAFSATMLLRCCVYANDSRRAQRLRAALAGAAVQSNLGEQL